MIGSRVKFRAAQSSLRQHQLRLFARGDALGALGSRGARRELGLEPVDAPDERAPLALVAAAGRGLELGAEPRDVLGDALRRRRDHLLAVLGAQEGARVVAAGVAGVAARRVREVAAISQ